MANRRDKPPSSFPIARALDYLIAKSVTDALTDNPRRNPTESHGPIAVEADHRPEREEAGVPVNARRKTGPRDPLRGALYRAGAPMIRRTNGAVANGQWRTDKKKGRGVLGRIPRCGKGGTDRLVVTNRRSRRRVTEERMKKRVRKGENVRGGGGEFGKGRSSTWATLSLRVFRQLFAGILSYLDSRFSFYELPRVQQRIQ